MKRLISWFWRGVAMLLRRAADTASRKRIEELTHQLHVSQLETETAKADRAALFEQLKTVELCRQAEIAYIQTIITTHGYGAGNPAQARL